MTPLAPRIAVMLDENTSSGATRYEAAKGYFHAIGDAGGLPFGMPYLPAIVPVALALCDGFLSVGGRFAYPAGWYVDGEASTAPASERLDVEKAIMLGFLEHRKPVLGICAGMQTLACLYGSRLTPDLRTWRPATLDHDRRDHTHAVSVRTGSRLARILGVTSMQVNSFHREAVAALSPAVVASAHAPDGIVEAIEVPGQPFAIGLQWHQELLAGTDHPGNAIFRAFVAAAAQRSAT